MTESTALVTLERQLVPLAPRFADVLGALMPPERLIRTVVVSVERLPALLDCDRQSLFNAAMSAACLGLEVDGVTGQAFLIPFKNRAQLVIGYKGYNTLAARSGLTVTGEVVREGDAFDFDEGEGWVRHKKKLDDPNRRIVAAWSKAAALDRPAVVKVLGIDDIMAIKSKSPGARRPDSPWNDPSIGFPAMGEKSAKRRLARSMPLNVMQTAARMDEAFEEQGRHSFISPDKGLIVDGEFSPIAPRESLRTPTAAELISTASTSGDAKAAPPVTESKEQSGAATISVADYVAKWRAIKNRATDAKQLGEAWNADRKTRAEVAWDSAEQRAELQAEITAAVEFLKRPA